MDNVTGLCGDITMQDVSAPEVKKRRTVYELVWSIQDSIPKREVFWTSYALTARIEQLQDSAYVLGVTFSYVLDEYIAEHVSTSSGGTNSLSA